MCIRDSGDVYKRQKLVRRLNDNEIAQYEEKGYIKGLPVFSKGGVKDLQKLFLDLSNRLPAGVNINKTNMWHKASKKFYDLAHTPAILDYVEDLLGPNFFLWGGQFFYKAAKSKGVVPWHQDSQYWPCLLYTSPSPRDGLLSRMPSSA